MIVMVPDRINEKQFTIGVFEDGMRIFLAKGNPVIVLKKIASFIFLKYQVRSE